VTGEVFGDRPDASPTADEVDLEHHETVVAGRRLHYVTAGPADGPPVVLLHGFPATWYTWHRQVPALAAAGHRVVVPDLPGYGRSEKPRGLGAYRMPALVEVVAALLESVADRSAVVVGHDWGGSIAWFLADRNPDLLDRLAVLNGPHPGAFLRAGPAQWRRSWYFLLFQVPRLPEWLLSTAGYRLLDLAFEGCPTEDRRRFRRALDREGSLSAAVDYYRALRRDLPTYLLDPPTVDVPTLAVWGEDDPALSPAVADVGRWVGDLRVQRLSAGHWVHAERPGPVNDLLVEFARRRAHDSGP
jgi:pimeloyl-ACP methyl ester carboxylesterase